MTYIVKSILLLGATATALQVEDVNGDAWFKTFGKYTNMSAGAVECGQRLVCEYSDGENCGSYGCDDWADDESKKF